VESRGITPPRYFPKKQHGIRAVVLLGGGERKGHLVLVVVADGYSVEQKGRCVECSCGAGGTRVYTATVGCGGEGSSCLWLARKK
jgi:hypothetical protein